MNVKIPVCCLVIFSIWISFFAPFIPAQNINNLPQIQSNGLQFRLSPVSAESKTPENPTPVNVENLSERETNEIFKRLPEMQVDAEETADFRMRSDSLKPPKTGKTIPIKFPSDANESVPDLPVSENLAVERFAPKGNIELVSDLSITFSQPMISVSSQREASENVPVVLSPEVKGKWRWLGTQTLILDAETRFPMATEYTAKIPKGTKSAVGGILPKDVSWKFTTPAPKIERFFPKSDDKEIFPGYAIMAAKFNQEIDESEILPKIKVFADGKLMPIKSVTEESFGSTTAYQSLGEVKPKHWLAFRTVELLPMSADVKVVFEKDLPSAEGSLTSESQQQFTFRTLEPLKYVKSFCGNYENKPECEPSDDFRIAFNHTLYPAPFDENLQVRIEPPIEDVKILPQHNQIYIQGKKKPNTKYKVTVSGTIKDFYRMTSEVEISADFEVKTEHPKFFAQGAGFITLDPNANPKFSVYSKNHQSLNIKIYRVAPEDYSLFRQFLREFNAYQNPAPTPKFGKLVFDKTVETNAEADALTETRINLSEAIPDKFGHAIIIAEPTVKSQNYSYENRSVAAWVQATDIGIDALFDYEKLTALVTDLKTAKPVGNAEIAVFSTTRKVFSSLTDARGTSNFELPSESGEFLLVKNGNDSAILAKNDYYYWLFEGKRGPYYSSRWFVFDDRKMYRPNEEVSLKGYIRTVTGGTFSDIAEVNDRITSVNYILKDARNIEIARGKADLNAFGAFDFKLKLPENINLGYQRLEFWSGEIQENNPEFTHNFQIQEFRRPEFEVTVAAETPAPFFVGTSATISAEAKYYTGGFLMNAEVNWSIAAFQTKYSPPGHESFNFGGFVPWWRDFSKGISVPRGNYSPFPAQNTYGKTDAEGKDGFKIDFLSANPAFPYTLRTVAEIQDVNRQTIADTKTFLVHPSEVYVGLRSSKAFIRQNESLKIEAIATDIDGKTVENAPVTIKAELKDWQRIGENWREVVVDTQNCSLTSAVNEAVSCEFTAKQGGVFEFTAIVLDAKERPNTSKHEVWVAGANTAPKRKIEEEKIELIPDKKDYFPNETAEILVNAPFLPAEGVMTLERNGIIKTERFTMNESSKVLQIPLEERFLPNIHVKVDLVGITDRMNDAGEIDKTLPKRPAFAGGEINLNISKETRKLNVAVAPVEKTILPGGKTKLNIEVKDFQGNAVPNSEVAVIAVDEGVLALTDYRIQNPLEAFYLPIAGNVQHFHSRERVLLGNPADDKSDKSALMSTVSARQINALNFQVDGARGVYKKWINEDVAYIITEKEKSEINIRRNFDALAIFSPSVTTDENGKAVVDLKLPDNLTRYRITAVAVTKSKQFGLGESNITAKQSLQVRPSAPRFMNFGDRAELPVVLQNQTDSAMTVNVAVRANNAILTGGNGKKVTVAANDRVEIRFPVSTEKSGTARFQIGAVSGEFADAAEITLPIYTPATSESFATYGTTDQNGAIVQTISAPKDVFSQFGGLEVTTSSTQLQELTDAFIYVYGYPFGCVEQVSSRVLSVAALRDILTAFEAKDLPSAEEIETQMRYDIARLQSLQHYDGGWSFWQSNDQSIPYVSVHVAHAIARAKAKNYKVSDEMIAKSLNYLRHIEAKYPKNNKYYSEKSRDAISAYALYVRDLLGDKDAEKAKKLIQDVGLEKLSAESIGWILSVLADDKSASAEVEAIKLNLSNRVTETAGNAHFTTDYEDGEYVLLSSSRRADGVILDALLKAEPDNSLIPKIVRGLLAHRIKGRWKNTQENTFILLALDKYFHAFEKETPDFTTKIWLGKAFAGEQKFAGRSVNSNAINVPMNYLQTQSAAQNLVLDKQGAGRLYYRIGLKYAPKNLKLDAADYGFIVSRSYEAIDNKEDVKQNADGSWTIKSGARIRVRLKMIAPTRRYHVALVDNLPAGIEIINPGLATSGNNYVNYPREAFAKYFPVEHQNLRDNRAEVFSTLLWDGVYYYSYLARATTPGNFVVPPAKAEEMYAPETFGRSATDFVKVE